VITRIQFPGAETHNGGEQPLLFEFDGAVRLLYKPVGLRNAHLFARLVGQILGPELSPPMPRILLAGGRYGFMSFVPAAKRVSSPVARDLYYVKCGALLAAAYALRVTDLHMENIIATPLGPVPIDLETAFDRSAIPRDGAMMATGLLTSRPPSGHYRSGFQGGGIYRVISPGLRAKRRGMPYRVMTYRKRREVLGNRLPFDQARGLGPAAYRVQLSEGFSLAYAKLARGRKNILKTFRSEADAHAESVSVRFIPRFTSYYTLHLLRSRLPKADASSPTKEARDRLRLDSVTDVRLKKLIPREVSDLQRGDVPYFFSDVTSLNVRHYSGWQCRFFDGGILEALGERLEGLCSTDRDRQLEIVAEMLSEKPESSVSRPL
jgi:lantibiotic modifying enzyme